MYSRYLITGASGFLGRAVIEELVRRSARIDALVLPDDPCAALLPKEAHTVIGDVCEEDSLARFFADADGSTCVIHCAGVISVASRAGSRLYQVNVGGTGKVIRQCLEHQIGKLIYVSSVHAIPEKPKSCVGSFTSMTQAFLSGKLPFAVRGGYDFVDVRDVAKGILACSEGGEPGRGYILSGHYITISGMLRRIGKAARLIYRPLCLPLRLARLAAPYYERRCLKEKKPLFFTPYSIAVLGSNGRFSHSAATERFAYRPRPIEQTLQDMTAWLVGQRAAAGTPFRGALLRSRGVCQVKG